MQAGPESPLAGGGRHGAGPPRRSVCLWEVLGVLLIPSVFSEKQEQVRMRMRDVRSSKKEKHVESQKFSVIPRQPLWLINKDVCHMKNWKQLSKLLS